MPRKNKPSDRKRSGILLNISLSVFSIISVFLVAEFACRIILKPKFDQWNLGPSYNENLWNKTHYEGDSFFRKKNLFWYPDKINILGLGDSFTFGNGVFKNDDLYLSRLQEALKVSFPVHITNLGKEGYNIQEIQKACEEYLPRLKPDIVLYGIVLNDLQFDNLDTQVGFTQNSILLKLLYYSTLGKFLNKHSYAYYYFCNKLRSLLEVVGLVPGYEAYINRLFRNENIKKYEQQILRINTYCQLRNVDFIAIILPMMLDFDRYPFEKHHQTLAQIFQQHNINYIDTRPAFTSFEAQDLWVHPYDHHPNAKAQDIIAKAIYPHLFNSIQNRQKKTTLGKDETERRIYIRISLRDDDQKAAEFLETGQLNKALNAYQQAIQKSPSARLYQKLGVVYLQQKMYNAAIQASREAIKHAPHMMDAYFIMGSSYSDINQPEKAIQVYQQALKVDPEYANAYYGLGFEYLKTQQFDQALTAFKTAYYWNADLIRSWHIIGYIYTQKGMISEAIQAYKRVIEILPNDPQANEELKKVLNKKG